jgi:hybrid cluster-associated redox disulfide protein
MKNKIKTNEVENMNNMNNKLKKKSKLNITSGMLLGNIMKYNPESISIMMDNGINCFACHLVNKNTLEKAANYDRVDLNRLLYEINNNPSTWR